MPIRINKQSGAIICVGRKQLTVKELQKILSQFPPNPPNLKIFTRPKYTGKALWPFDYPLYSYNICPMEPTGKKKNITILF